MIYKCDRCHIEHDYSTIDGLLKTIAHLHFHHFDDLGFTNTPDGNMRFAEGALEWFEGKWGSEIDYFEELTESGYAAYAPYYLAYKEGNIAKSNGQAA